MRMSDATSTVRIRKRLLQQVKVAAILQHKTMTDYISEALAEKLRKV